MDPDPGDDCSDCSPQECLDTAAALFSSDDDDMCKGLIIKDLI